MPGFKKINGHSNMIYNQLIKYRKQKGLSYEELAQKMQLLGINMYRQKIYEIECDKRTVRDFEIYAFAKALDISYNDLLSDIKNVLE